mgnify:CR=1 FL=1
MYARGVKPLLCGKVVLQIAMLHPPGTGKFSIGAPELPENFVLGELEAAPQEGIVVVDPVFPDNGASYSVATSLTAREHVPLAGTGWQVVVHDGMVCVSKLDPQGGCITRPADGLFSKSLWIHKSTGEIFVRVGNESGLWQVGRSSGASTGMPGSRSGQLMLWYSMTCKHTCSSW